MVEQQVLTLKYGYTHVYKAYMSYSYDNQKDKKINTIV